MSDVLLHAILSQVVYASPSESEFDLDINNVHLHRIYDNNVACAWIFTSGIRPNDLHVVFKGSHCLWHAKTNINLFPTRFPFHNEHVGLVHSGYLDYYKQLRTDLLDYIFQHSAKVYPSKFNINIAGHSMGGAVATLMGMDLVQHLQSHCPSVNVYTYGAPPFCDHRFSDACYCAHPRLNVIRVVHKGDIVPHVPMPFKHIELKNVIIYPKIPQKNILKYHSLPLYIQGLRHQHYHIKKI